MMSRAQRLNRRLYSLRNDRHRAISKPCSDWLNDLPTNDIVCSDSRLRVRFWRVLSTRMAYKYLSKEILIGFDKYQVT